MKDGIFMFFYVDNVVFAFRADREHETNQLIDHLKKMFEFRDMRHLQYFLKVRVIQDRQAGIVHLVQDAYMEKLIKDYEMVLTNQKITTPLSYQSLTPYSGDVDQSSVHLYRQKVGSVCYPAIITRPDIAKAAFKLAEFLTNPGPYHLVAVDHCIRYLHATRYLALKFDASGNEELIVQAGNKSESSNKHVFEASVNASYANEEGRRSDEGYTFKLFGGLID
jgi:hypothetical protein